MACELSRSFSLASARRVRNTAIAEIRFGNSLVRLDDCTSFKSRPDHVWPVKMGVLAQAVSVIVPVYNRSALLSEAVTSAIAQSYGSIEVIIVDDGSTDPDTASVIDCLVAQNPCVVRSIRISNRGPGRARQRGLEIARGEFIQFLDSDDLLLPSKLEHQVVGLKAHPRCALSYGKTREYVIGSDITDQASRRTGEKHEALFPAALQGRLWATETPLFRRSALDEIGTWSNLRVLEDWEYECRLGAQGASLHYCDEFVSEHRHHAGAREGLRWQQDDAAFKDMLSAHVRVLAYAREAGVQEGSDDMKCYARNLFRLARDAAERNLTQEASELLQLTAEIDPARRLEYRFYKGLSRLLGWKRTHASAEAWRRLKAWH